MIFQVTDKQPEKKMDEEICLFRFSISLFGFLGTLQSPMMKIFLIFCSERSRKSSENFSQLQLLPLMVGGIDWITVMLNGLFWE